MASKTSIDRKLVKTLEPFGSLSYDKLDELVSKAEVEDMPAGRLLFRQGERDRRAIYLLSGQVELTAHGKLGSRVVKAKTAEARQPLVPELPRTCTARTKTPATILSVDTDLLEILLSDGPPGAYEVTEISGDNDASVWMFRFLQSPAFLNLPTENIQALIMRMEEVPAKKGTVIIRQGDRDEYYYIVKLGHCQVSRRPAPKMKDVNLATLGVGDGFGEEALITGGTRNATITMLEDGVLMRLSKDDFNTLLVNPLLRSISAKDLPALTKSGAVLVDVRGPEEFHQAALPGAVNIPLSVLRLKLGTLEAEQRYIVYCDDGSRSRAAAFLMSQQGLAAYVLEEGLHGAAAQTGAKQTAAAAPSKTAGSSEDAKKRLAQAESAQKRAEAEASRLKAEAQASRQAADQEAERLRQAKATSQKDEVGDIKRRAAEQTKLAKDHESALRSAESELEKVRADAESARKAAAQELAQHSQAAEQTRLAAQEEADRLKAEAEAARRRAEEEAQRSAAAEKARAAAQAEAEKVRSEEMGRKEAEIEATRRQAAEAERQAKAAEAARVAALEEANRLKAEAESARRRAEQEADAARREAEQEVQRILAEERARKEAEIEAARRQAMEAAEQTKAAEAARQAAQEEARRLREEAEEMRRQALEEAERLKAEAEAAREDAMREAARNKAEAARRAQAELEAAQQRAEEEARRAAAAEAARQQAESRAADVLTTAESRLKKAEEARRMAATIAKRLQSVEKKRRQQRSGAEHTAHTGLRRVDNKLILEGEEDIFVFVEPNSGGNLDDIPPPRPAPSAPAAPPDRPSGSSTLIFDDEGIGEEFISIEEPAPAPEVNPAPPPAAAPTVEATPAPAEDRAPSANRAVFEASPSSYGAGSIGGGFKRSTNRAAPKTRPAPRASRRGIVAIAATLVVAVGVAYGISEVPWSSLKARFASGQTEQSADNATSRRERAARLAEARSRQEAKVVEQAEGEFSALLREWRKKLNSVPMFKRSPDAQPDANDTRSEAGDAPVAAAPEPGPSAPAGGTTSTTPTPPVPGHPGAQ